MSPLHIPPVYERASLLDSSAFVAILDPRESRHEELMAHLVSMAEASHAAYVTSFVVAETYRRLLYKPNAGRSVALKFIRQVFDGSYNIVRPDAADEQQASRILEKFHDQNLTFTDATSMAVMSRLGLRKVVTLDWHFTLLGFEVLP